MSASAEQHHPGLRIARIHGVPVYVGSSWLILAAVILVISTTGASSLMAGLLLGVLYAVSLLVAVLAHEAGHAVVARMRGLAVARVVADLWGGHTAFDARQTSPGTAAVVAAAGPAVNLLLGVVFVALGWLPGLGALWTFGFVNLLLAGFNLLPGLPLDGGQLVDAAVWGATGRRDRGLVVAGWSGRVIAVLVATWAVVVPLLRGGRLDFSALWMLMVAWFLWQGASAAIRTGGARRALGAVSVAQVTRPAVLLPPHTSLATALGQEAAVVTTDERGRPTLVLVQQEGQAPLGSLDPDLPLSAVVTRFPDGAVVDVDLAADVTDLVIAIQETGWAHLVLTRHGSVVGVTDAATIDAAVGAAEGAA